MKLVSSSPEPKHTHRVKPGRSWLWSRVRSRVSSTRFIKRLAWLLLVVIVAVFAISVFSVLRHALETAAGQ